jgi:hypothetical protein
MTSLICFLLICNLPSPLDNRSTGTDTSTSFHPLHMGDLWRYTEAIKSGGGAYIPVGDVVAEISRDTLIDQKTYSIIEYSGYLATDISLIPLFERRILARFDSTTGNYYKYNLNLATEILVDSSTCITPGTFSWWTLSIQDGENILNLITQTRSVVNGYEQNTWAKGIGRTYAFNIGFRTFAFLSINYAKIAGVVYEIPDTAKPIPLLHLEQNQPNPLSSQTTISYSLESPSNVHLTIYDILGRKVRDLPMACFVFHPGYRPMVVLHIQVNTGGITDVDFLLHFSKSTTDSTSLDVHLGKTESEYKMRFYNPHDKDYR